LASRAAIHDLLDAWPGSREERERSLGLFVRGSLLARIVATGEIYKAIVGIPGAIFDVGTWRGQTAVLCENFRAIYEPLNLNRRIVAFDTFEGYAGFGAEDTATDLHRDGTYRVGGDYRAYLERLLRLHEESNVLGHNSGKHTLVAGDIRETLPGWFETRKNELVALAFLDVNAVEPTRIAVEAIWPRLVPGGMLAVWQLTRSDVPAEGFVYLTSILGTRPHTVTYAPTYPGLGIIRKTGS
jgi:hypothetical protein